MAEEPKILDSLEALFSAFPTGERGNNVQAIRAYLMAVEDIQPRFVAVAVRRFIRGEVERDKHAFCPVAPELAIEARRLEKQADVDARIAASAALPKPKDEPRKPPTAEEREKVAALMEGLAKGMLGHKNAQAELIQNAEKIRHSAKPDFDFTGLTISPAALSRVGIEPNQKDANG